MGHSRGRPTDVYALGACLYTFVFGRIPFNAPNVFKLFQVVQNEPLRFPDRPQVSPLLQDLLLRMLHKVRYPSFESLAFGALGATNHASRAQPMQSAGLSGKPELNLTPMKKACLLRQEAVLLPEVGPHSLPKTEAPGIQNQQFRFEH